jgi:hypothetical protein
MTHYCDVTNQNKILQQNNLQIVRVYVKTNEGGESSHQEGDSIINLLVFLGKRSQSALSLFLVHIKMLFYYCYFV